VISAAGAAKATIGCDGLHKLIAQLLGAGVSRVLRTALPQANDAFCLHPIGKATLKLG